MLRWLRKLFHLCDNNMRYEVIYGYCSHGLGQYEVKMCKVCGYMENIIYNFVRDEEMYKQ